MYPYLELHHMATYVNVNPSQVTYSGGTPQPTQGKRYQDAGMVYFRNANVKVDVTKAVGFKNRDRY